MDVFNSIIELVKALPDLAVWILVIFYGFKVVVVGSIYGTIRFVVDRIAAAWEASRKFPQPKIYSVKGRTDGIVVCCDDAHAFELLRSASKNGTGLHGPDIDWAVSVLKEANKSRQ